MQSAAWKEEHIAVAVAHTGERRKVESSFVGLRSLAGLRSPDEGRSLGVYRCRNIARRTCCRVTGDRDAVERRSRKMIQATITNSR